MCALAVLKPDEELVEIEYLASGEIVLKASRVFKHDDPVSWHYRSAIGHGYVKGVARADDDPAKQLYDITQVDHHPGEPEVVQHTGAALTLSSREAVEAAREAARRRDEGKQAMTRTKDCPVGRVKAGPDDGLEEGQFLVYPSTFTKTPDAYGDVVKPGAFADTLAEWKASGNTLPGLYGHRMDDPDYNIASTIDTGEDEHGWWVKGQFDMESPKAAQVYRLVKGRRLSQLSFAYDTLDEGPVELEGGVKANELRRLKVYEFSFVPVGANQDTSVVAVKSAVDALAGGVKEGRVLAAKHIDSLRKAQEAIGAVIAAAEGSDQAQASGQAAHSKSEDERIADAKSADEKGARVNPSARAIAQAHIYALQYGVQEGALS